MMHPRLSVHSLCLGDATWPELADGWRQTGARRVSLLSPLLDVGLDAVRETLERGGLALEAVTHLFTARQMDSAGGWEAERAALSRSIDMTAGLGGNSVYMMSGGHGGLVWEEAAAVFAEAVRPCVVRAEEAGIGLLIEPAPPLYADGHLAHSLRDTVTLAEIAGLGVCIDLYSCWMEADLQETIARAMPRCRLVQVSDYKYGDRGYPSRAVPGEGDIPLRRLIGWIVEAGYAGNFDFELIGPRIAEVGHVEAVKRAGAYMGALLEELGV